MPRPILRTPILSATAIVGALILIPLATSAMAAVDSDTYRDGTRAITDQVRDKPLGSLLIAGGIGFALAMMMTRPPRRRSRWY